MQLERILQSQGFGSRKECRALVRHGLVAIAGATCEDPFVDVPVEGLVLTVDGEDWAYRAQACLMLNKPAGYEVSQKPVFHPSVFTLLPPPLRLRGVQSVGRLDEDTTGLLIFTDDGQLIHQLSSAKRQVPKHYRVTLKHVPPEDFCARLMAGVTLHDEPEPIAAAHCEMEDEYVMRLTITSGKYHQVKRMVGAAGNRVEALCRTGIGQLQLPADLPEGEWRWLSEAEIKLAKGTD